MPYNTYVYEIHCTIKMLKCFKIFLSKISEKKEKIFDAYAKSCLIESAVCATKTKECIKNADPFASSWVKCAAFYLQWYLLYAVTATIGCRSFVATQVHRSLFVIDLQ